MLSTRLPDGSIQTMRRAEDPATGAIGDAVVVLTPGDPGYAEEDAWLRSRAAGPASPADDET